MPRRLSQYLMPNRAFQRTRRKRRGPLTPNDRRMTAFASQVADYLSRYRRGDREAAFFGLLETDHAILPELVAAFRSESDSRVRAFLVEVIWLHRQQSVIPFLGEALR